MAVPRPRRASWALGSLVGSSFGPSGDRGWGPQGWMGAGSGSGSSPPCSNPARILLPHMPLPSSIAKDPSRCGHLLSTPQTTREKLTCRLLPFPGRLEGQGQQIQGRKERLTFHPAGKWGRFGAGEVEGKHPTLWHPWGGGTSPPGSAGRSCLGCSCRQRQGSKQN